MMNLTQMAMSPTRVMNLTGMANLTEKLNFICGKLDDAVICFAVLFTEIRSAFFKQYKGYKGLFIKFFCSLEIALGLSCS